jgi:4'-phosphopantetheinyl transferase
VELEVRSAVCDAGAIGTRVHAWGVDLSAFATHAVDARALLSAGEQERATRFHSSAEAARYVLAHAILRLMLGEYVGRPGGRLTFQRGANEKPQLIDDPALHFNISHSGDLLAIGVTRASELGIDVETEREIANIGTVAQTFMSPRELADFSVCRPEDQTRTFLEHWTRKEAYAKAIGAGIAELDPSRIEPGMTRDWEFHDVGWTSGCVATLAIRSGVALRTSVRRASLHRAGRLTLRVL